jgi:hypothetical protein
VVPVLNWGRPEPVGGGEAEVGAGAGGGLLGHHPSQSQRAVALVGPVPVGAALLAQVLQAAHLRHARERLRLALVVPR